LLSCLEGRLAQLVEHLLDMQGVTGSSPVSSTILCQYTNKRKKDRVKFGCTSYKIH
jgi:hypothetical protein